MPVPTSLPDPFAPALALPPTTTDKLPMIAPSTTAQGHKLRPVQPEDVPEELLQWYGSPCMCGGAGLGLTLIETMEGISETYCRPTSLSFMEMISKTY